MAHILVGNTTFNAVTFTQGDTYTLDSTSNFVITGSWLAIGTDSARITMEASSAGNHSTWAVTTAQLVSYVDATWIDSTLGTIVSNSEGTVANCIWWEAAAAPSAGGSPIFWEWFE